MSIRSSLDDLAGQVVLITGGGGHIARAMAASLAELGCKLCLADKVGSDLESFAGDLSVRLQVEVIPILLDLEKESERRTLPEFIERHFGRLDVLINNAAFVGETKLTGWVVPFEEQTMEAVRRCLEVNLTAAFHVVQLCSPLLRASGGRVINVGSIYGVLGPDMRLYDGTSMGNPAGYAMSKGGLVQLTRWLATVLAPDIRVNCISLGGVFRNQNECFVERYVARTPLQRMASEEDFVGAVAFLGSKLSSYITGQNLMIDGGWSAW